MTCLHNHDQILEFLRKIFLKGFQIYQNYLCALTYRWLPHRNSNNELNTEGTYLCDKEKAMLLAEY